MTECKNCERLREKVRMLEKQVAGWKDSRDYWYRMFGEELKVNLGLTSAVSNVRLPSVATKEGYDHICPTPSAIVERNNEEE